MRKLANIVAWVALILLFLTALAHASKPCKDVKPKQDRTIQHDSFDVQTLENAEWKCVYVGVDVKTKHISLACRNKRDGSHARIEIWPKDDKEKMY